jgi:adenylate cyclase
LGFALSLLYLSENHGMQPETTPEEQIKLGSTIIRPFQSNDGAYVREDDRGYQFLLNYRGDQGSFETVSVEQVLQGKVSRDQFKGKIVLIGSVAKSLNDFFETPYNAPWLQFRSPTPGVEIHAQITSQVISSVLDQRPAIQTWPELLEWVWILAWSGLGAGLVWRLRHGKHSRIQSLKALLSLAGCAAGLMAIAYFAFVQSWWIPLIPPLLGLGGSAIAVTAYFAQSASELRKTLGRYLTDEVVAQLLETPEGFSLIGEKRKVTTLMVDIRGFTSISEKLLPEEVVQLLNLYLSIMTRVIKQYGGIINDITGDGIVIFFGAPIQQADDAHRAVACALAMQLAMESVNQTAQTFDLPRLEIGIGINTGDVIVGNIGSEELAKYTAIGRDVNLASRIESFTVGGQVLISPSTLAEVESVVRVEGQTQAFMKGVDHAVALYEVSGITAPYDVFLPDDQDSFVVLKHPILVEFELLEGKHLSGKIACGKLFKLSSKGAVIQGIDTIVSPAPLTNLKLKLTCIDEPMQEYADIYAKVTSQITEEGTSFCIRFTDVPARATEYLQTLRSDRRARH